MDDDEAWAVLSQLASAVSFLHCFACIVHRDLKPSNVLVFNVPDGSCIIKVEAPGLMS